MANFTLKFSKKNLRKWLVIFFILAIVVCFCYSILTFLTSSAVNESSNHIDDNSGYYFPLAKKLANVPGVAFVYLALGPQANQLSCPGIYKLQIDYFMIHFLSINYKLYCSSIHRNISKNWRLGRESIFNY